MAAWQPTPSLRGAQQRRNPFSTMQVDCVALLAITVVLENAPNQYSKACRTIDRAGHWLLGNRDAKGFSGEPMKNDKQSIQFAALVRLLPVFILLGGLTSCAVPKAVAATGFGSKCGRVRRSSADHGSGSRNPAARG
jgi:hypothetical protein